MNDDETNNTEIAPFLKGLAVTDIEPDPEESYDPYNTATNIQLPADD